MIQRIASHVRSGAELRAPTERVCRLTLRLGLAGLLGFGLACGSGASHAVPRTLAGSTARGAFVPPYAYEAYVRGELLLLQGQPAQAVAQLELAATAPDDDAYLLSRLAYAQLQSGDRAEAARTLARAAELERCSEAVWLMRGTLAESTQEVAVARAAYEKASACAPGSARGELALVQLLLKHGDEAAALDLLVSAAERSEGQRPMTTNALRGSLKTSSPAALAHAFDSLGAEHAPDSVALEQAIRLALERDLPRVALRLREQHAARLPPALEARLLSANGLRSELSALIAANDSDALGGHAQSAQLALEAHAYERAELEATTALQRESSDAMHAVRARASIALGRPRAALPDVVAIREPSLRRGVLEEALSASGAPALARELGARAQTTLR